MHYLKYIVSNQNEEFISKQRVNEKTCRVKIMLSLLLAGVRRLHVIYRLCVCFISLRPYSDSGDITLGRRQSKMSTLSRSIYKKSIETVFSISICRHTGGKWQSKTLFLSIFDPRLSIADSVFDCLYPMWICHTWFQSPNAKVTFIGKVKHSELMYP